jgi:hypothetical protein
LNSFGPVNGPALTERARLRPTRVKLNVFYIQADRGFARSGCFARYNRDYVCRVKWLVCTTISFVLYNIVRYVTSKKGGNAPRGLRIKRSMT